jgi:hypothetical protein
VQLWNNSAAWTAFTIATRSADATLEGGIPEWLDMHPTSGVIPPQVRPGTCPAQCHGLEALEGEHRGQGIPYTESLAETCHREARREGRRDNKETKPVPALLPSDGGAERLYLLGEVLV